MHMGKPKHLNVPETEASRALQYHKAQGSDNSTDLLTKAFDHDGIKRHTAFLASECNTEHQRPVLTKRSGRVDTNGHAQQKPKDHKQGEGILGNVACRVTADTR